MENENKDWYKDVTLKTGEEMNADWWSPEPGKYEVLFLSEAGKEYTVEFERNGKKEIHTKIPIEVEVNGKQFVWGITIGKSESSIYGQLVKLGLKHQGIKDIKTEILVTGIKKDRRYTIPEVVGYQPEEFHEAGE